MLKIRFRLKNCMFLLSAVLSFGCGRTQGTTASMVVDEYTPSSRPSMQDMLKVTAPGYISPVGMKQDCFGRMVFDVAAKIEWPTFYKDDSEFLFYRSFSAKVADRGDEMTFGDTKIAVLGPANAETVKKVLRGTPSGTIQWLQEDLDDARAYFSTLTKADLKTQRESHEVKRAEDRIKALESSLKEERDGSERFDSGLPDSEGYWKTIIEANSESRRYSIYRVYLIRDGYIYVFESHEKMDKPLDKEAHKQKFIGLLKKFRVRKQNEIPTELGVCIPHGFISDDGKTLSEFKQSMRWPDAPGVVYTIETGNVHPRRMKSTGMMAATKAAIGKPGSGGEEDAVKDFVTQRIGPRSYKIGGLTGEQGGVALTVKRPGKEPFEAYSLFTGYSGWLGTAVLPYITVDMHTYTMEQAPELKQNPPPFKESMERLDLLLKSMRLRPTNPPMPDFAAATK
jgi:hypothetical protein